MIDLLQFPVVPLQCALLPSLQLGLSDRVIGVAESCRQDVLSTEALEEATVPPYLPSGARLGTEFMKHKSMLQIIHLTRREGQVLLSTKGEAVAMGRGVGTS